MSDIKIQKAPKKRPLTPHAYERPDNRSLVAVCDLRPITMGERVMRYVRTPSLKDDLIFDDDRYDPDDFHDDEDRPMSPHEERAQARLERKKAEKAKADQARQDAATKKKADEEAEFAARVKAIKEEIPRKD